MILAWTTAPCINCSFIVDTPSFTVNLVAQVATPTFTVVETPVTSPVQFSPGDGTSFIGTQLVTLTTATTAPYEIRYTVDGTAPNAGSLLYSVPLNLSATTRVRAIAVKTGYTTGAETEATYTLSAPVLPAVVISPAQERYFDSVAVTLSCADGVAQIRYTTNGATPTESDTLYTVPFTITQNPLDPPVITTVKAKAFRTSYTPSATASQAYNPVIPVTLVISRTSPNNIFWISPTKVVVDGGPDLVAPSGLTVPVGAATNLYIWASGIFSVFNLIYDGAWLFPEIVMGSVVSGSGTYTANTTLSGAATEILIGRDLPIATNPGYFLAEEADATSEVTIKIYAY